MIINNKNPTAMAQKDVDLQIDGQLHLSTVCKDLRKTTPADLHVKLRGVPSMLPTKRIEAIAIILFYVQQAAPLIVQPQCEIRVLAING